MSSHREGVNPLRPYYIPPTIGDAADAVPVSSAKPFAARDATANAGYASRARHVFADIDYKDYIGDSSPTMGQNIKELVDELIWKYASVLMAQPFEVAKTILQAKDQSNNASHDSHLQENTSSRSVSAHDVSLYTALLTLVG